MTEVILCLDIGGTNCRFGLVDRESQIYGQKITATAALAEQGFMEGLVEQLLRYVTRFGEQFRSHISGFSFHHRPYQAMRAFHAEYTGTG